MKQPNDNMPQGLANSQHRMKISAGDEQVYNGMSTVLTNFNEDMRKQACKARDLEDYRIKHTRLESYFVHHNIDKYSSMLYQMDLRTNERKQVPAAQIANAQARTISKQADQIISLQDTVNSLQQSMSKSQAELAEFRIKVFIQETKISKLEAELAGFQTQERVKVNGDHGQDDYVDDGNGNSYSSLDCAGEII